VIHFDFDRSDITDEAKSTLDAKVPVLNANPAVRIRVAGHTDSRGSDEYNLALGQRRAAAAKRYLTQRGVDASRIDVISYGEERPAAQGEDESAWSQNRRDEFEITAGGDNITAARQ
jgi:peptidoglycan-associated lipoprotein